MITKCNIYWDLFVLLFCFHLNEGILIRNFIPNWNFAFLDAYLRYWMLAYQMSIYYIRLHWTIYLIYYLQLNAMSKNYIILYGIIRFIWMGLNLKTWISMNSISSTSLFMQIKKRIYLSAALAANQFHLNKDFIFLKHSNDIPHSSALCWNEQSKNA